MSTDPRVEAAAKAMYELVYGRRWAATTRKDDFRRSAQAALEAADSISAGPAETTTTEWGVRRDVDSPCHSLEWAQRTIETQRKRGLKPLLIKRQVGPWEVSEP